MTFDNSISETVSLSKILDFFIEEGEKPSVILSFLNEHCDTVEDIIKYSEFSDRLFFVDFIARCSHNEAIEIMKLMKRCENVRKGRNDDSSITRNVYAVWQIAQSNLPQTIKNIFMPYIRLKKPLAHPYSHRIRGTYIYAFDSLFRNAEDDICTIADNINRIKDDAFDDICFSLEYSIFSNRVYQSDLFVLLDTKKQYMLLNELRIRNNANRHLKFLRHILCSSVDVEIKKFVYGMIDEKSSVMINLPDELLDVIIDEHNFSKTMIMLDLGDIDNYASDFIFYLVCRHNTDWLYRILDSKEELFEKYFDIRDMLCELRKDGMR